MRHIFKNLTGAVCLASCIVLMAGCASTGYDKSDAAAKSIKAAAADVQVESQALDFTVSALTNLVNNPATDLKPQYRQYQSALERLVSAAERTDNTVKRMEQRNTEYFQAWDQRLATIEYEHIRNVSASRKTAVTNSYERVHQRYLESKAAMGPMIQYLSDMRMALSTDLTTGGLAAVKATAANAEQNAAKVQKALAALSAQLEQTGKSMSSLAASEDGAARTGSAAAK